MRLSDQVFLVMAKGIDILYAGSGKYDKSK